MFRRKNIRFFMYLVIGVLVAVIASFFYNAQKESRDMYIAVKEGKQAVATVCEIPGIDYNGSETNKYRYTFVAEDGVTYAASTLRAYSSVIKGQSYQFLINYAVDNNGNVRLNGDGKAEINGQKYPIALSFEDAYFQNSRAPGTASSIIIFVVAGALLGFALYNAVWILIYKNVENKGELSYALFVSASASKFGSAKYMSVVYKYQDNNGEWIEAKTPYTYNALDAEKLKFLETFKIRYKGKRSVIAENLRGFRL